MRTLEAQELALQEMKKWDLLAKGWRFEFDQRKRRFGSCSHYRRVITLSAPLTLLNPQDEVLDTILHEIAHALAGHLAGHGPVWKAHCGLVGARPERCYDSAEVVQPEMNYTAVCGSCGKKTGRDRLPRRVKACGHCCRIHAHGRFDTRFVLNFYRTGTRLVSQPTSAVQPPPVGQLSLWQGGKYVPVAHVTKIEFKPPAPAPRLGCFDPKMCVYFYQKNMRIVDIAMKMGYPHGQGQNRVRKALQDAGVYR